MAPVFVPSIDSVVRMNNSLLVAYSQFLDGTDMEHQVFGPNHDSKVDDICSFVNFLGSLDDKCDAFKSANDDEVFGFGPIATKILKHYSQNFIADRFQEYSACWGLITCHETDLVNLLLIDQVPMTYLFGE